MIIKTIEIYKCEFCKKLYQRKNFAEKHEKICTKNPRNFRPCFWCTHLKKKNFEHWYDTYCGEGKEILSLLHCDKIDSFLYPPRVEEKGNFYDLGDTENNPMPIACDQKSYDYTV